MTTDYTLPTQQSDVERTARNHATVPREVADRLAEALLRCLGCLASDCSDTVSAQAGRAYADYRKAVSRG